MRSLIMTIALLAAFLGRSDGAQAFDESKYPDWKGQWRRADPGPARYDPSKPLREQQAPLTEEYRAIYAASIADQLAGGQGNDPTYMCLAPGMPRIMSVYDPLEIVITQETTYFLIQHIHDSRRIFTDGRSFPEDVEPLFAGYSVGKWIDTDGDGRFDTLDVETRALKGPRQLDASGIPLHADNQTVVKERISLDKANRNVLRNEVTVFDNALTRPWSVVKTYRRDPDLYPVWREYLCSEDNGHVAIGKESYFISADGHLMPSRKGQEPPDLRNFQKQ